MQVFYLLLSLAVPFVAGRPEPPVFMGLQQHDQRVLPLNAHTAMPHIYQQLPLEHDFNNFVAGYGAPAKPLPPLNNAAPATPNASSTEDSYNAAYRHSFNQQHQTGYDHGPMETQVHKHIYVHVPPKDFEEEAVVQPRVKHQGGRKQKHYKIVFIKAPEAPIMRLPSVPPQPQSEEKTLIYVLHKRPETQPDIVIPTPEPTKPSKPEVFFIKYNTKRDEAPVYGPPPPAFNEFKTRQADGAANSEGNDFMPMDLGQYELEATTQLPLYQEDKQQLAATKFVSEEFSNGPTVGNFASEEPQMTTADPLNQYLPPETTPLPIVVKEMEESAPVPTATHRTNRRNRFFIKKKK